MTCKRRFSRIKFNHEAKLEFAGRSYFPCKIRDISLNGMFVLSRFVEKVGTTCRVLIHNVGPGSDFTITADAIVIRENMEGIAVSFISMESASYMFFQAILLYLAVDPFSVGLEYPSESPFTLIENHLTSYSLIKY